VLLVECVRLTSTTPMPSTTHSLTHSLVLCCAVALWLRHVVALPPPQEFLHGEVRQRRRYRITQFPQYLVLHLKRFTKNTWFVEKNPTIVTFPVKNLELKDCTSWFDGCDSLRPTVTL